MGCSCSDSLNINEQNNKLVNKTSQNSENFVSTKPKNNQIDKKIKKRSKQYTTTIFSSTNDKNEERYLFNYILKNQIEPEDKKKLEKIIKNHFFMKNLDYKACNEIISEMSLISIEENKEIFRQNSDGFYFYIIKEGEAQLKYSENNIRIYKNWDYFGEIALLHQTKRLATATTLTKTLFYILSRESFKRVIENLNFKNFEQNKKFIESVPILNFLDSTEKSILCQKIIQNKFNKNFPIVKEGEIANSLYIIKLGEVNIVKNDEIIRTLKSGDYFGEFGILIENSIRTCDVISKTDCICYSVSITTFKKILGEDYRNNLLLNLIKGIFLNSKYFNDIYNKLLEEFFNLFKIRNLLKNEILFNKDNNITNKLIVVVDGNLIYSNNEKEEYLAKRGEILFEDLIWNQTENIAKDDIIAFPDCLIVEADINEIFNKINVKSWVELINKSKLYKELLSISFFQGLKYEKIIKISEKIKYKSFKKDDIIINKKMHNKFIIVKNGKIDILKDNKYIRSIYKNDFFGDKSLMIEDSENAIAIASSEKVEIYELEDIEALFSKNSDDNLREFFMNRLGLHDNNIELEDLNYICKLGQGSYGQVCLVENKKTNYLYSIKAISINQIISNNLTDRLLLEKQILLNIDHPFIVKLVKSLKDKTYIFLIMEYVKGKELYKLYLQNDFFSKFQSQFYSASMLLAINYLHQNHIIYRDIKMENIMVCENGYIKLIDFGAAKILDDNNRTTTIIGTPHYMAPELILGEGYSYQIDYWSIAVCLYEFYTGEYPFGEGTDNPSEIYNSILNDKLDFPENFEDINFKRLMLQMLNKSPLTRMSKLQNIKKNNWFKDFDWESLENLNIIPQITLKTKNKKDKTYGNMNYKEYVNKIMKENEYKSKNIKFKEFDYENWISNF